MPEISEYVSDSSASTPFIDTGEIQDCVVEEASVLGDNGMCTKCQHSYTEHQHNKLIMNIRKQFWQMVPMREFSWIADDEGVGDTADVGNADPCAQEQLPIKPEPPPK
ncbi:hypothetical protein EV182_008806, partial [Spiromyces aspiralis]